MKWLLGIVFLVATPFAMADFGDVTTCIAEHPDLDEEFIGQGVQRAPIAFPSKIVARRKAKKACKQAAKDEDLNPKQCKIVECITEG